MSGRDMLKSYSQAALRPSLLNDSETRLNNTSDLTRLSLPGLRTADKTINSDDQEGGDFQQIVKTKQTKFKVRKSQLMRYQDNNEKIKKILGCDDDDDAKAAEMFLKENLTKASNTQTDEFADLKKSHKLTAEIKLARRQPSRESATDSDQTLGSGLPFLKVQESKSILHQIREHEKEAQIKKANKTVRQTIMDLEKLAVNDKEMIELQRKTIYIQQLELQELKRKFVVMQRNMQATSNATKHMQDEITLVKEDRVVLELHNKNLVAEKEQIIAQQSEELTKLKLQLGALQMFVRKLNADHSRESKQNRKTLKSLLDKHANVTVNRSCQTDPESSEKANELNLYALINEANSKKQVRKARLPLTAAEDELIFASRAVGRKKVGSQVETAGNRDDSEDIIIRDTFGLRGKEGTHANVGLQAGNKVQPHMQYLVEHLQTKTQSLGKREETISSLKKQLEELKKQNEVKMAELLKDITGRLKAEHSQVISLIIKEKDSQQQKVVAALRQQRDEQCLLKEAALKELEALKNELQQLSAIKIELAQQRVPLPLSMPMSIQSANQSEESTPVSSIKNQKFGKGTDHHTTKHSNYTTINQPAGSELRPRELSSLDLQVVMEGGPAVEKIVQDFEVVGPSGASRSDFDDQQPQKQLRDSNDKYTREMIMQTDEQGNPVNVERQSMQTGPDELNEASRILISKTTTKVLDSRNPPSTVIASAQIKSPPVLSKESSRGGHQTIGKESSHHASINQELSRQESNRTPTNDRISKNDRIPTKPQPKFSQQITKDIKPVASQHTTSDPSHHTSGPGQKFTYDRKVTPSRISEKSPGKRPIIKYVEEASGEHIKEISDLKSKLEDMQRIQDAYYTLLGQLKSLQEKQDDLVQANQDLRWQVRNLQETHEAKVSKLRDKREQIKQTLAEAQETFSKESSLRMLEKEKYQILLEQFTTLERKQRESEFRTDAEEKRLKQDLSVQMRINVDNQILIDQLKQKLFDVDEKNESIINNCKSEVIQIKQSFLDLKKIFEKKLIQEKQNLHDNVQQLQRKVTKLTVHVSCLGCDQVKSDSLMLLCGHNICSQCLNLYSKTDHPRSSVRCEVCSIETKVAHLSISLPNRSICDDLTEIRQSLECLISYDLIGEAIVREVFKKSNFDRISDNII